MKTETFQVTGLGDVCDVVDGMILAAEDFRTRHYLEYDTIMIAEVHQLMYDKLVAWGALDYLAITYFIHVKIKEDG